MKNNQDDRLSRIESMVEALSASAQQSDRNAEADRAESRAFRLEIRNLIDRIDGYLSTRNESP